MQMLHTNVLSLKFFITSEKEIDKRSVEINNPLSRQ